MAFNIPQHAQVWGRVITTGLDATEMLRSGLTINLDLEENPGEAIHLPVWNPFTVSQNTNCPTPDDEKETSDATAELYTITPIENYIKIGFCQKDIFAMRKSMKKGLLKRLALDMILSFEVAAGTALAAAITTNVYGDNASVITPGEFAQAKTFVQARSQNNQVICGCSTAFYSALISQANIDMTPILAGVKFIISDSAFTNESNFIYPIHEFHYARLGGGVFFKDIDDATTGSTFTFVYHIYGLQTIDDIDNDGVLLLTQDLAV